MVFFVIILHFISMVFFVIILHLISMVFFVIIIHFISKVFFNIIIHLISSVLILIPFVLDIYNYLINKLYIYWHFIWLQRLQIISRVN
jgi:hypothetical protein